MKSFYKLILHGLIGTAFWALPIAAQDDGHLAGGGVSLVVGGEDAQLGEIPFIVQIAVNDGDHICGGSLIDTRWVVTAAHCLTDYAPGDLILTLGEHDLDIIDGAEQVFDAAEVILHPEYDDDTADNDIALIRLSQAAIPTARVATIAVSENPAVTDLIVSGWGHTDIGAMSRVLQRAAVSRFSMEHCHDAYPGRITGSMFCAGTSLGDRDSCSGDSGGPLVFNTADGPRLVGIVSWGMANVCGHPDFPGVYTEVSLFESWINDETGIDDRDPSQSLGGVLLDRPECVSRANNRIDCFARGLTRALFTRAWDGTDWSPWVSLGGAILDPPACTSWGSERIDCFARGLEREMWHIHFDQGGWSDWQSLGGRSTHAPSCTNWGPGRIDCFARGRDRAVKHRWMADGTWYGWEDLGGIIADTPTCISPEPGRIDCFGRGTDTHLWHKAFSGGSWSDWHDRGGRLLDPPTCISRAPDRINCFGRGGDSGLWQVWWNGSSWSDWQDLGGNLLETPDCVTMGPERMDCFVRDAEELNLAHRWYDAGTWYGWELLGGALLGRPDCVVWGADRLACFGRGVERSLTVKSWNGDEWVP